MVFAPWRPPGRCVPAVEARARVGSSNQGRAMDASDWDWTRIVIDHIDVHASNYSVSVRFYETVLTPLGIPRSRSERRGHVLHQLQRGRPSPGDDEPAPLLPRKVAGASRRVPRRRTRGRVPIERRSRLPRVSTWLLRRLSPRSGRQRCRGAVPRHRLCRTRCWRLVTQASSRSPFRRWQARWKERERRDSNPRPPRDGPFSRLLGAAGCHQNADLRGRTSDCTARFGTACACGRLAARVVDAVTRSPTSRRCSRGRERRERGNDLRPKDRHHLHRAGQTASRKAPSGLHLVRAHVEHTCQPRRCFHVVHFYANSRPK